MSNILGFTYNIVSFPLQYVLPASIRPTFYKHKTFEDTIPLNHARLIDDLIDIHGYEILIDGYYNGDCHPVSGTNLLKVVCCFYGRDKDYKLRN